MNEKAMSETAQSFGDGARPTAGRASARSGVSSAGVSSSSGSSVMSRKNLALIAAAVVVLGGSAAAFGFGYLGRSSSGAMGSSASVASAGPASSGASSGGDASGATRAVARINGEDVAEMEIAGAVSQGVDRAVAIDAYINRAVTALAAKKAYPEDAKAALRGAEREVLSQLYVARRQRDISAGITEAQIKAYYDANVKDIDYAGYRIRAFVTQDPKDAQSVAQAIAQAEANQPGSGVKAVKDFEGRFKRIGNDYVAAQALPYGLNNLVRQVKKGEFINPIVLRDGIAMFYLEDVREGKRPELTAVQEQIRAILTRERLDNDVRTLRQQAKIELN